MAEDAMAEEIKLSLFAVPIVHNIMRRGTVYIEAQSVAEASDLMSEGKWVNLEYENEFPEIESYLPVDQPIPLDERPLKRCHEQPPPPCDE